MMEDALKPGQRLIATVDGKRTKLVFSLETEEKGDRRDHCFRYDKPYFPIVPKDCKVVVLSLQGRMWKNVPNVK
jgi:hypothetical protein